LHILAVENLCGLVIRVPGYRSRGPGFDFQRYHIFCIVIGLEHGTFTLVSRNEELLEKKIVAPIYKTEINGCGLLLC
jgi:hypothetical protein